jgi:uncharacterized membrane protein
VKPWSDEHVERLMGRLLRSGVVLAALVLFLGGVLYLSQEGTATPQYHVFHSEPSELRSLSGIVHDARALRARGIMQLGLLVLIATPIARVAFSLVAFVLQRDRTYVVVTLTVLSILAYSLMSSGL